MFSQPGQACWAPLPGQNKASTVPPAVYGHSIACIKESAWGGPLVVTFGGTTGEGANAQVLLDAICPGDLIYFRDGMNIPICICTITFHMDSSLKND